MEEEKDPFDAVVDAAEARSALRRRAQRDFIKGPIDWEWMLRAGELRSWAVCQVANMLWRVQGLRKSLTFALEAPTLKRVRLSRRAVYRSLGRLEGAGLLTLTRRKGRRPLITIILPEIPHERR